MIFVIIIGGVVVLICVGMGLCRTASPPDVYDRILEDDAQMKALSYATFDSKPPSAHRLPSDGKITVTGNSISILYDFTDDLSDAETRGY